MKTFELDHQIVLLLSMNPSFQADSMFKIELHFEFFMACILLNHRCRKTCYYHNVFEIYSRGKDP